MSCNSAAAYCHQFVFYMCLVKLPVKILVLNLLSIWNKETVSGKSFESELFLFAAPTGLCLLLELQLKPDLKVASLTCPRFHILTTKIKSNASDEENLYSKFCSVSLYTNAALRLINFILFQIPVVQYLKTKVKTEFLFATKTFKTKKKNYVHSPYRIL